MFYALCAGVCLAVLFITIAGTLLLSSGAAWLLRRHAGRIAPAVLSNLLFAVRLLPLMLALFLVIGFALPSFLRFEPHTTTEGVGWRLILLSILGIAVLGRIGIRWYRIHRATALVRSEWLHGAQKLSVKFGPAPVYSVERSRGVVAVLGTFRPRVFVAQSVLSALTPAELEAVLAHETGHVRAFDNLKQLLMKITQPPRWLRALKYMDAAWTNASELAADEAALAAGVAVEDLASALVKVLRIGQAAPTAEIAASHLVPNASCSAVGERVLHLQHLLNGEIQPAPGANSKRFALISAALSIVLYVFAVNSFLPLVHEALEWLVR